MTLTVVYTPRISLENDFLPVRILSVGENFKRQLKGICNHAWAVITIKYDITRYVVRGCTSYIMMSNHDTIRIVKFFCLQSHHEY